MPRRRRYGASGLVFHVVNRGSRRGLLCEGEDEFQSFEQVLVEALDRHPIALIEFCLMRNHFHLVVQPANDDQLADFMHWLTSTHATRWRTSNRTLGEGAVYQGRYKAIPVHTEEYFYTLVKYVHRNPVRAGAAARAEEWRWGSLWHRQNPPSRLHLAPWPLPKPDGWLDWVNQSQPINDVHDIRKSVNRSFPLGNQRWRKEMAYRLGIPDFERGRGRPKQR